MDQAGVVVSEIFDAARNGELENLRGHVSRLLLSSQPSTSLDDKSKGAESTTLTAASNSSRSTLSTELLFSNLRDDKGSTPLHYAAGNGHVHVCRFLLNIVSEESQRRLTWTEGGGINKDSIQNASQGAAKESSNAATRDYANISNKTQGRSALHWAARNGHLETCQLLVQEFGASIDPLAKGDVTPLQLAVWQGHVRVCVWLSIHGNADKHFCNSWGCTVHHWLAKSPIYAQAKAAAAAAAASQSEDKEQQVANERTKKAAEKALADAKARLLMLCHWLDDDDDENSDMSNGNNTTKCRRNQAWSRPNDHGQTPLHKAGFGGNMPLIQFLLDKGISDTHRDAQHNTAADCAERNEQWESARYLRRHGNPICLQKAKEILFPHRNDEPQSPSVSTPPSLKDIRSAYLELAKIYHPDRLPNEKSAISTNDNNSDKWLRRWKDLYDAYELLKAWWEDPDEADGRIRALERHHLLQRQLPPMVLWHELWHQTVSPSAIGSSHRMMDSQKEHSKETHSQDGTESNYNNNNNNEKRSNQKKKRKAHSIDPRAEERLLDFERRLGFLLKTLPNHEVQLSQLPKEFQKGWGGKSSAMIRAKDYGCKHLGYLLETRCSQTVEVFQKPSIKKKKESPNATVKWVRIKRAINDFA